MGLAKKLGKKNQEQQKEMSNVTLSEGGYNYQNVPMASAIIQQQPLTAQEINEVNKLRIEAIKEVEKVPPNTFGLLKPEIPLGPQYPCEQVSVLVVDKIWRIVCLNNLYAFYTQIKLQQLVERACKHDYNLLKKKMEYSYFGHGN